MIRSLYSAISGLKNHQTRMDVIGNNIANVNTTGFKRSRVSFASELSQTMKGASAPSPAQGGINAMQVGMGMRIGAIDQIITQGTSQSTGNPTDMMLQGTGFFVLNNNGQQVFTRAGGFSLDNDGTLIDPATGAKVQGYSWGTDDSTPVNWGAISDIRFKIGDILLSDSFFPIPEETMDIEVSGDTCTKEALKNLQNFSIEGMTRVPVGVIPALGQYSYDPSEGKITFATGFAPDLITLNANYVSPTGEGLNTNTTLEVDESTQVTVDYPPASGASVYIGEAEYKLATSGTPGDGEYVVNYVNGKYQIIFGANQADGENATNADGATISYDFINKPHILTGFSIDQSGVITGVYSNGVDSVTHKIAQVAIATFANETGLQNVGGSFYTASNNSGVPNIGAAGEDGRASIISNSVEMSNVDLSTEFTDMIVTQRGFQANSRVVTVSDTLLEELINLKR